MKFAVSGKMSVSRTLVHYLYPVSVNDFVCRLFEFFMTIRLNICKFSLYKAYNRILILEKYPFCPSHKIESKFFQIVICFCNKLVNVT